MYKHFFGLRENPFNVNPDPRFLFLTSQTQEALDELTYGIHARKGLILLTGEVGTGKTTLINHLLDWLHLQQTPTAFIFNSHLEINHLFDFMLADFGLPFDSGLKSSALMRLNEWLFERYRAGETPVLIVDEAQGLPTHVLEEIRMLLNLETSRDKLLQIVLAGQPELEERLKRPELRQVKQRIALRCKTAALTLEETHNYIQARLHIAGANGKPIFSPEAMDAVNFYSRGIPRVINLLCENALMNAYVEDVQPVPESIVAKVAREFQFDDAKPVGRSMDFGDPTVSNLIALQSTFANAPVSVQATAEQPHERHPGVSASRGSGPFVVADTVPGPTNEAATPVPDCETIPVTQENEETVGSSDAPGPASAGHGPERVEAGQSSELIAFFSDAGIQSFFGLTTEAAPPFLPVLREFEVENKFDFLPTASRFQASSSQKFAHPQNKINLPKSGAFRSSLAMLIALGPFLVRWSTEWWNRFLSAITSPAQTQRAANFLRVMKQSLHASRAWYPRAVGWKDRCLVIVGSMDWPRMKASAYQWLQQPLNLTKWRVPYSRLFEARHRLSHKKM